MIPKLADIPLVWTKVTKVNLGTGLICSRTQMVNTGFGAHVIEKGRHSIF